MKVSASQLSMAVSRLKSTINGYSKTNDDLAIELAFTTADPGTGQMVDTMTLTATSNIDGEKEDKVTTLTIELYPESEKQEARCTKVEQFKLRNSYG